MKTYAKKLYCKNCNYEGRYKIPFGQRVGEYSKNDFLCHRCGREETIISDKEMRLRNREEIVSRVIEMIERAKVSPMPDIAKIAKNIEKYVEGKL